MRQEEPSLPTRSNTLASRAMCKGWLAHLLTTRGFWLGICGTSRQYESGSYGKEELPN